MVLIFDPVIKDVKSIKIIGKILMAIKKSKFLSLKLILKLIFFTNNQIKIKNGTNIPTCFNKKITGNLI